jgi:hypothetical protein
MVVVCAVAIEDLLPQLAAVVVERVESGPRLLRIMARTRDGLAMACPGCGQVSRPRLSEDHLRQAGSGADLLIPWPRRHSPRIER